MTARTIGDLGVALGFAGAAAAAARAARIRVPVAAGHSVSQADQDLESFWSHRAGFCTGSAAD